MKRTEGTQIREKARSLKVTGDLYADQRKSFFRVKLYAVVPFPKTNRFVQYVPSVRKKVKKELENFAKSIGANKVYWGAGCCCSHTESFYAEFPNE